jgi:hypothetical protein
MGEIEDAHAVAALAVAAMRFVLATRLAADFATALGVTRLLARLMASLAPDRALASGLRA